MLNVVDDVFDTHRQPACRAVPNVCVEWGAYCLPEVRKITRPPTHWLAFVKPFDIGELSVWLSPIQNFVIDYSSISLSVAR